MVERARGCFHYVFYRDIAFSDNREKFSDGAMSVRHGDLWKIDIGLSGKLRNVRERRYWYIQPRYLVGNGLSTWFKSVGNVRRDRHFYGRLYYSNTSPPCRLVKKRDVERLSSGLNHVQPVLLFYERARFQAPIGNKPFQFNRGHQLLEPER